MTVHKDGLGIIIGVWLLCIALIFVCLYFIPIPYIAYPVAALFLFPMVFIFFFFRVPKRRSVPGDNVVTSVADGEVVIIEKVYEKEFLMQECIQVSVYMDFFNVHVNFWPLSGNITYYKYHPGKYLLAFLPKASEFNEHTSICVENEHGKVFFRQLAGTFARRIVCYAKEGETGTKGSQCGIIKFGSRIDMFLPLDADIKVEIGDEVFACESVIAELK
ncbi:MAG: phosphatidylserine decarboxylase family protein [Bacteroidales bacterium]|nr:phosphatidylserine decarboxylase family protein [Bacteroidales bacterium]